MILNRVDDPRSNLQKATRYEVFKFAKARGVAEITSESMPKNLMIRILRSKGITNIAIPPRVLGGIHFPGGSGAGPVSAAPVTDETGVEVDAEADLARQWAAQQAAPPSPPPVDDPAKPAAKMTIIELGNEMKRLGIKRERRDNMITMRQKIEAKLG